MKKYFLGVLLGLFLSLIMTIFGISFLPFIQRNWTPLPLTDKPLIKVFGNVKLLVPQKFAGLKNSNLNKQSVRVTDQVFGSEIKLASFYVPTRDFRPSSFSQTNFQISMVGDKESWNKIISNGELTLEIINCLSTDTSEPCNSHFPPFLFGNTRVKVTPQILETKMLEMGTVRLSLMEERLPSCSDKQTLFNGEIAFSNEFLANVPPESNQYLLAVIPTFGYGNGYDFLPARPMALQFIEKNGNTSRFAVASSEAGLLAKYYSPILIGCAKGENAQDCFSKIPVTELSQAVSAKYKFVNLAPVDLRHVNCNSRGVKLLAHWKDTTTFPPYID